MNSDFTPRKAEKKRVKLKMAVQGPSGSGKTWGALALARNLWPEAKICVVDTENESASLYADKFNFDTIPLGPPFTTARYVQCIDAAVRAGYDVLILDTITAQWDGPGGILQRKNEMDMRGGNGFANWVSFTPEHEAFKQTMLQAPVHVIATMRSKQDYILQADDRGKQMPKKVGTAPIQRDQIDYEFTIVFDVQMDHKAASSKDRTGLFSGKVVDLADLKTADVIRGWLESGVEAPQNNSTPPAAAQPAQPLTQPPAAPQTASQGQPGQVKFTPPNGLTAVIKAVKEIVGLPAKPASGDVPAMKAVKAKSIVTFLGVHNGCSEGYCFDAKFFPLLKESIGMECHFQISEKDVAGKHYVNIENITEVDGQPVVEGKVQ